MNYIFLRCYVGPERSQWRKCSEKYYPYLPETDKIDDRKHFSPNPHRQPWRPPIFRPDRPPGQHPVPPPALSLDQYEMIFNEQFLEPPLPGNVKFFIKFQIESVQE